MPPSSANIPRPLLPYLEDQLWKSTNTSNDPTTYDQRGPQDLILVTQVLSYSANWLLLRFIQSSLRQVTTPEAGRHVGRQVILLSYLHDFDFWRTSLMRLGVNVDDQCKHGSLVFIDALGDGDPLAGLDEVEQRLSRAQSDDTVYQGMVILDGPDVALAAAEAEAIPLLDRITSVCRRARCVVCALHVDMDLGLKPEHATIGETPLELQQRMLVMGLAACARMTMGVRGLDSGRAKDVSGVITIAKGIEDWDDERPDVGQGEWLYLVKGDGAVTIFRRGEGIG